MKTAFQRFLSLLLLSALVLTAFTGCQSGAPESEPPSQPTETTAPAELSEPVDYAGSVELNMVKSAALNRTKLKRTTRRT